MISAEADNRRHLPIPETKDREGPIILPRLSGDAEAWFALYVQVNHEKEVSKRLQDKSFQAFLPLMETWSKRKDRRKKLLVPLFPGYVFLRTVLDNYATHSILRVPGAVKLLSNSEGPLPIPEHQVQNLETLLQSQKKLSLYSYLQDGQWIRVARGPLKGCVGILVRRNPNKGRLVVSIDLIQRSVSVELDVEDVEPFQVPLIKHQ